ncbi:MAG TPA: PspC domain-containing protein [Propionibacteriaceae bacterium]|nr:PspC domain-containing protein [Propionibacteriaceae bacterium]
MSEDYPTTAPWPPAADREAPRRLRRSRKDRVLFGVCGGLGRYLNIDPVVLRIITLALIFAGVGVVAYLVAWLVIPEADEDEPDTPADPASRSKAAVVVGASLVALGVLLLARTALPWFDSSLFWPLVVVGGGVLLVATARR